MRQRNSKVLGNDPFKRRDASSGPQKGVASTPSSDAAQVPAASKASAHLEKEVAKATTPTLPLPPEPGSAASHLADEIAQKIASEPPSPSAPRPVPSRPVLVRNAPRPSSGHSARRAVASLATSAMPRVMPSPPASKARAATGFVPVAHDSSPVAKAVPEQHVGSPDLRAEFTAHPASPEARPLPERHDGSPELKAEMTPHGASPEARHIPQRHEDSPVLKAGMTPHGASPEARRIPERHEGSPELKAEFTAHPASPEARPVPEGHTDSPELKAEFTAHHSSPELKAEFTPHAQSPDLKAEFTAHEHSPQVQIASPSETARGPETSRLAPGETAEFKPHARDSRTSISDRIASLRSIGSGLKNAFKGALGFGSLGMVDEWGKDEDLSRSLKPVADFLYDRYFRVKVEEAHLIPTGPVLIVANHSGALPLDGPMLHMAMHRERPDLSSSRWLVEDQVFHSPMVGVLVNRLGAVRAHPENAIRLLDEGRPVIVFPEGFLGISKPFRQRYQLKRFGRGGYIKIALRRQVPIVPVAIVGAEESMPLLGKIPASPLGFPYLPLTPPPLPATWRIRFSEPITLKGSPEDLVYVQEQNDRVRDTIAGMLSGMLRN